MIRKNCRHVYKIQVTTFTTPSPRHALFHNLTAGVAKKSTSQSQFHSALSFFSQENEWRRGNINITTWIQREQSRVLVSPRFGERFSKSRASNRKKKREIMQQVKRNVATSSTRLRLERTEGHFILATQKFEVSLFLLKKARRG